MFSLVIEALTFAVKCLLVVSTVGAVKFLSSKPPRGVAALDLAPMDRYREVYGRVFDLIVHKGGVVDNSQRPSGHGFMARRYNQIRAVRASVIVTSTVAAMSTVTAIQNVYNTAVDDIARLPRGRLLPLTTLDVRPSSLDASGHLPGTGGPDRYSDYFVAARSIFEAAINATKILVLFESLCIVNALVSGKRFIDHRRTRASRGAEAVGTRRSVLIDNTHDGHVDRSTTHNDDGLAADTRKSPQMATQLAIIANKHYSSLWNTKKGLDPSMSGVFSSSDSEQESKLGISTVKAQNIPPSFRRRNTVLKKLSTKKDSMKDIRATLDALENIEKGKTSVYEAPLIGENTYEQPQKVHNIVQGLRRRNTAFRNSYHEDPPRYARVKVTGIRDDSTMVVGAVLKEGTNENPEKDIVQNQRIHETLTIGSLPDDKTTASSALNLEDVGKAARFNFDGPDIACTEVVVDRSYLSSSREQKLEKVEEGVLHSSSGGDSLAQGTAICGDARTMKPTVGDTCTVNGKQAAVIRPISVSNGTTTNEATARRISFRDMRSKVREQALAYASGVFVSCYTAAIMHMSLYFSLREKYRNPTARSSYSELYDNDELDVINGMPVQDFVSPVVHACRVSLSTAGINNHTRRNSR